MDFYFIAKPCKQNCKQGPKSKIVAIFFLLILMSATTFINDFFMELEIFKELQFGRTVCSCLIK